jgi:hypothetical protein
VIREDTRDGLVERDYAGTVVSTPEQRAKRIFIEHGCVPQSPKRFMSSVTVPRLKGPRQRGAGRPRARRRSGASSRTSGSDPGDDPEPGKGPAQRLDLLSSSTAAASFGAVR